MHKIKAQAKRQAWSNDDGTVNFNPFGKLWSNTPSRRGDEEDGLSRTVSDGRVLGMGSEEEKRRSQFESANKPQHASTMPVNTSHKKTHNLENGSGREVQDLENGTSDSVSVSPATKEETNGSSKSLQADNQLLDSSNKPRKRKMGGLLGKLHVGKKDVDDTPEQSHKKVPHQKFTLWSQIQHTIFNSWINILLLTAPVGIALNYAGGQKPVVIFVVNFIAIIPLAAMLSYATEEIALYTGETIGGLLNATFGNAVELIVSLFALFDDQIDIVQTSLIGSMLSNLLLVLGMCFFLGGLKRVEQHFNVTVAQTASALMALAIGSLIIPTVYKQVVGTTGNDPDTTDSVSTVTNKAQRLTEMSRGVSILLLLVYGCYLYFQLSTHAEMYNEPSKKAVRRKPKVKDGDTIKNMARASQVAASSGTGQNVTEGMDPDLEEEEEKEIPKLSKVTAFITLAVSTAFVALCAEAMVDAIDGLTESGGISREFVGLILLPIVGNAAEHATAVTVAIKDKMDLSIGVAVGSTMQIALLVLPLIVVIGWIAGKTDMNLAFDTFQVIVLFVSVLLVNYLIGDGKSHWLEGVLLNVLYIIIAVVAWYYPIE